MFRRKSPPPEVTNESFRRWLRAHTPPWLWFLALSEIEQEQLAMLGDEHAADMALAIGDAVRGTPGGTGDDEATEATMVQQLAAGMVARLTAQRGPAPTGGARPEPVLQPPSMSGIAGRRQAAEKARHDARNGGRRLFGRAPDPAAPGAQ